MDFSLPIKITKELILDRFSEETIFNYYLGFELKPGRLYRSELRRDKNPTCSAYKNKSGTLCYHDFATGDIYNCFSYVMAKYSCSYHEALRIIANDLGIIHDPKSTKHAGKLNLNPVKITEKEATKIQVEIQDFTQLDLKWWGRYGIDLAILKKYNVYSCKHIFLNGKLVSQYQQHCPIYGYYGHKYHSLELWRCYFPKRKQYRFISNWPKKKIQGYEQLPKTGKVCVITKSMKDTMCLYSLGIPACAPCSENLFVSDSVLQDLKNRFKYIAVLYDNDRAGLFNMAKFRKKYPELIYTFIPKKYEAKDISDFYAKYGREKTLLFLKKSILWLKSKVIQM